MSPHLASSLAVALAVILAPAAQAAPYTSRVLANNLANPRGLLMSGNQLLVSEAGSGGAALPGASNCILSGAFTTLCAGLTGALGSWDLTSETYSRLITGLPSLAQANGTEGTGLADLTIGGPTGLLGVFGFGGSPSDLTASLPGNTLFAQVVSIDLPSGALMPRANLASYEQNNNPDGGEMISNPYAVQVFGGKAYATDAGGNSLLTLGLTPTPPDGTLTIDSAFAFPSIPITPPPSGGPSTASAVPTGLTVNPATNELLIGQFSGYPFVPGSASVYATDGGTAPLVSLTGFTNITDVAADADGNTYVLEYSSLLFGPPATGGIWRVTPGGTRERIIQGLTQPTSLALGPDGTIFVTNKADGLQGELVEYRPVPIPSPLFGAALAWSQARRLRRRLRQSSPGAAAGA